MDDDLQIIKPSLVYDFIYLRMHFTITKCAVVGACRNRHTLFIGKAISDRVSVKYRKHQPCFYIVSHL